MKLLLPLRAAACRLADRPSRTGALLLGVGLSIAVVGLLALSYPSVADRRRNSQILAERRAEVLLALLTTAMDRDMKAVHTSVLLPFALRDPVADPPTDLRDIVARTFVRFPYPESFFLWSGAAGEEDVFFLFNRADRPPSWDPQPGPVAAFPAVVRRSPASARPLLAAIKHHAAGASRDVTFECTLGGNPYQVVAKLAGEHPGQPPAIVGFTVNLRWARDYYFDELAASVLRVRNEAGAASIVFHDEGGRRVAGAGWEEARGPALERQFSPLFFDPRLSSTLPAGAEAARLWTARVEAAPEPTALGAGLSIGSLYAMLAALAVASVLGMLFTTRKVLAHAALAERRSEFISTVTHELKTPLASIRLLAETLSDGRYASVDAIRDYAGLLSREAWRLTRLIDNLLAYASVSSTHTPSTERHEVSELLDEVVAHFHPQFVDQAFVVTVEVPPDLPRVRGDRTALLHALDNLVDNAIKYSTGPRELTIRAWAEDGHLSLEVADRGQGVAPSELPHVFEKFYRGRGVRAGGSGLGLAIVKRVVDDHGGTVEMRSVLGKGTAVRLVLPRELEDA